MNQNSQNSYHRMDLQLPQLLVAPLAAAPLRPPVGGAGDGDAATAAAQPPQDLPRAAHGAGAAGGG